MRKALVIVLLAGLTISETAFAQNRRNTELRIGYGGVMFSKGRISGPQLVRQYYGERSDVPFDEHFSVLYDGLYLGLRLANGKVAPGIALLMTAIHRPISTEFGLGWEISFRYNLLAHKLWKRQRFLLYGLASLTKVDPLQEKTLSGYAYNRFLLPGLGVGGSVGILCAEVRFHKWPGLKVGEAFEPLPDRPAHPWLPDGTWKPIRLKYAVNLLLGIEFMLFKF